MKQCDNGHFYDENRFDSCPYCRDNAMVGKTVAGEACQAQRQQPPQRALHLTRIAARRLG